MDSIKKHQEQASNLSLNSETGVTVNLTTFELQLWSGNGNGPQEGPGDRQSESLGSSLECKMEEMGNLGLQKGELPKLLCIVFYLEKMDIQGSGKPMAMERCKSNNET